MSDNIFYQIENLINLIDLKKLNLKLIKTNVKKLINIYQKLNDLWKQIDLNKINYTIYPIVSNEYKNIIKILNQNFLSENKQVKKFITKTKFIHSLSLNNIHFYWLSVIKDKNLPNQDYLMGLNMFKITYCLNKFKFGLNSDNIKRIVIWIPIDKKRNFYYNKITDINLNESKDNFEAFVASGVTFGFNPKITIITRYEEVEKLLIHELIHNYNMDGSGFHTQLKQIMFYYKSIKPKSNYDYEYSIYESYTELLSTYFYLLFDNIIKQLDLNLIKKKLVSQIILEIIYSYNTVCNLIKLMGINDYDYFVGKKVFDGEICIYEYYYIKALMYNNYLFELGSDINDFKKIYQNIIDMIKKNNSTDDILMKDIFNSNIKQNNYKYQLH